MTDAGTEPLTDGDMRAADGRVPGRRGRATRDRLLEHTAEMLQTTSYRDLKVVDIARQAGTSPATFYQYFPDVESATLVLADEMAAAAEHLADRVRVDWSGGGGAAAAASLVDGFFHFWDEHRSLLRVVDLAAGEGDLRFRGVRSRLLNGVTRALDEVVAEQRRSGAVPNDVDTMAVAGVLVAMLAHVSAHRLGFEFWGIRTRDVRAAMQRIILWSVTGETLEF